MGIDNVALLPETCGWAFKEWAVVCEALASGKQSLLLRKGGIHEGPAGFQVEHNHFWLYPTAFHQASENVIDSATPLLQTSEASKPASGTVRLSLLAEVTEVAYLKTLDEVLALEGEHIWSTPQIEKKFFYRAPGLYLLRLNLYQQPQPWEVKELPSFSGCKTWVPLAEPLATNGLTPVTPSL